jgi:glyoxylase-like metal-dependent hydrolase (beta-lactamase superfamily II)
MNVMTETTMNLARRLRRHALSLFAITIILGAFSRAGRSGHPVLPRHIPHPVGSFSWAQHPGGLKPALQTEHMTCKEPVNASRPAGWFKVIRLDEHTFALSEPQYWQANVNYLLIGTERALLFDTGPGVYRIRDVVESLTSLPVLVIPSHLHFDHTWRMNEFDDVALIDLPTLRAQTPDGVLTATESQFLLSSGTRFSVNRWLADGTSVELGGRSVMVIITPGHTPDSVSLIDSANKRLFIGDLVNRDITLANVPGSDVESMATSVKRLLQISPAGSEAREAHSELPLNWTDLQQFADGLTLIVAGKAAGTDSCLGGLPMLRYDIGAFPVLLPGPNDARLRPLGSPMEELEWLTTDCLEKK